MDDNFISNFYNEINNDNNKVIENDIVLEQIRKFKLKFN